MICLQCISSFLDTRKEEDQEKARAFNHFSPLINFFRNFCDSQTISCSSVNTKIKPFRSSRLCPMAIRTMDVSSTKIRLSPTLTPQLMEFLSKGVKEMVKWCRKIFSFVTMLLQRTRLTQVIVLFSLSYLSPMKTIQSSRIVACWSIQRR